MVEDARELISVGALLDTMEITVKWDILIVLCHKDILAHSHAVMGNVSPPINANATRDGMEEDAKEVNNQRKDLHL